MTELNATDLTKKVRAALRIFVKEFRRLGEALAHASVVIYPFSVFQETYSPEDNTIVVLYSDDDSRFSDYLPRTNPDTAIKLRRVKVSLIATAYNEAENIQSWIDSIFSQTRLPDEIVVTDAGSSDYTYKALLDVSSQSPIPFKVIRLVKGNIAQGRNCSIQASTHDVIAVTDFGVTAHTDWLDRLVAPFEIDPDTEVSGGWYQAISSSVQSANRLTWQKLNIENPRTVLSPGVSIAFLRQAWEKVGGYPEWLTLTGEDTYFDLELRRCTSKWAFVPQALVDWEAPGNAISHWKKTASWAKGDGETGLHAKYYLSAFLKFTWTVIALVAFTLLTVAGLFAHNWLLAVIGLLVGFVWLVTFLILGWVRNYSVSISYWRLTDSIAQVLGYLSGSRRRLIVSRRRLKQVKGIFFILAGVPIDDTGGGSRFAQIALEMIRQGYAVIYLHKFRKGESADLKLIIRHPNLFHYQIDQFDIEQFLNHYDIKITDKKIAAFVEVPLPEWLPILHHLDAMKVPIIYDLLDDWDTNLGGRWFQKEVEQEIVRMAGVFTATTPSLVNKLESMTGKPATLLPNAVNLRLFNPRRIGTSPQDYHRPADAPIAPMTLIYIGALYGSWFDWDMLLACAQVYPQAAVLVIGDYSGFGAKELPNLYYLGLKRQVDLPAYLALADVAIIPWKVDSITLAVSPLKLYEYLAMEKPVVVPNLPALAEIPGVYISANQVEFLQNIRIAANTMIDRLSVQAFIAQNSWEVRVEQLWQLIAGARDSFNDRDISSVNDPVLSRPRDAYPL